MYNDWYSLYLEQQKTNDNLDSIEAKIEILTDYVESGEVYLESINNTLNFHFVLLEYLLTIIMLWLVLFGLIRK